MEGLTHIAHWLVAMALLAAVSAFFSASEAALFLLRPVDRRRLASGNRSQRAAARLLEDPDRLLSSVLFWNLSVNVTYFTIASLASIQLGGEENSGSSVGVVFGFTSLMVIIRISSPVREPGPLSVLRTRMLKVSCNSRSKVVVVNSTSPEITKEPLSVSPLPATRERCDRRRRSLRRAATACRRPCSCRSRSGSWQYAARGISCRARRCRRSRNRCS